MRIRSRIASVVALTVALAAGAVAPASAATPRTTISIAPRGAGVLPAGSALDLDIAVVNHGTVPLGTGTIVVALEREPVLGVHTLVDQVEHPSPVLQGYRVATAKSPAVPAAATAEVHVHLSRAVVDSVIDDHPGARLVGASLTVGRSSALAYSAVTRIPQDFAGQVGLGTAVRVAAPAGTTGVVPPAELGALTQPDGAWRAALEAAQADPAASVLLDPEVQASIRLAGSAAPPSATAFLDQLDALPNEMVRLPYADGDVTLERAAGAPGVLAPTSFAGGSLSLPAPAGTPSPSPSPTAAPTPTTPPSDAALVAWNYTTADIAWPVPGTVSNADLPFLARSGYPVTVLSSADVADTAARVAAGPHARIGSASVLVADGNASRLLASAASGTGVAQDSALAELVALLGTDAVTHEAAAVLALPPRTGPSPGLAHVLTALSAQRWIQGTGLAALAHAAAGPSVRLQGHAVPEDRAGPATAAVEGEAKVRELGTAIRTDAAKLTGPQRLALLAVLSTAWRAPQTGYVTAARTVTEGFREFVHNVRIDKASVINYVGGSGGLPVYVTNQLTEPVRVVVSATSSNGRLQIRGNQSVDVPAESGGKALLPVKSISNGEVVVTVTLRTPDGHVIGSPSQREITVNAGWETVGAVVFVVALLALFGTGVYRNVRRARRRLRGER